MSDAWKQAVEAGNTAYGNGRVAEAERIFLEALEEAEKFGEEDVRLAVSLNNVAAVYHTMGKYTMAEPLYKRALDIRRRVQGETHTEVAVNLHNLAVLYSARRMFPVAEKFYKEAIAMKEQLFGMDTPELLNSLAYYAQLLKVLNRPVDQVLVEQRMKDIRKAHPELEAAERARAEAEKAKREQAACQAEPVAVPVTLERKKAQPAKATPSKSDCGHCEHDETAVGEQKLEAASAGQ